jgi:hypothetical protein
MKTRKLSRCLALAGTALCAGLASAAETPATVGEAASPAAPEIPTIARETGVLTRKGGYVIEPSVEYAHTSVNRVVIEGFTVIPAITVGAIDVRRVDRDQLTLALTGRYGVTDRLEFDLRLPYVARRQSTTSRAIGTGASSDTVTDVSGHGIGDVEMAFHYQFNRTPSGGSFYVGNLRVKSRTGKDPFEVPLDQNGLERELPTGTGFWSLEPSVTAIFPSDPVVFYGNLGYLWNIKRRGIEVQGQPERTTIDPGDALRFSFGMGFGVNEKASFSLGYEHSIFANTKRDGAKIEGSDLTVGSLLLGWSYKSEPRVSHNVTLAVGVTADAPDVRLLYRRPVGG